MSDMGLLESEGLAVCRRRGESKRGGGWGEWREGQDKRMYATETGMM